MREWLETDGLGGFSMGPAEGPRTRRYHALLLVATTPPTGRVVLVSDVEATLVTSEGRFPLASETPSFQADPWPTWLWRLASGHVVEQQLFVARGTSRVHLSWRLVESPGPAALEVRPLVTARDYHHLVREPSLDLDATWLDGAVVWRPRPDFPQIRGRSNGAYSHDPQWRRGVSYAEEERRGYDSVEDLASPGVFSFDLSEREAQLSFGTGEEREELDSIRDRERARRAAFPSRLHRAADAYIVRRGEGHTIIAGYPWFTDWGRDTFLSLRGLCLATRRHDEARSILLAWAACVSEGMLPNRFTDVGDAPEFNSVDASLWFVIAADAFLQASAGESAATKKALQEAISRIVAGYAEGTRFGIRMDEDGLLRAGTSGLQLTWMDAKAGDWVVTPRVGKPVEVQALWINALAIAQRTEPRWGEVRERATASFRSRFWNAQRRMLYDVVDCDHEPGRVDDAFRPNQLLAIGGLPLRLLSPAQERAVVAACERALWTPMGLRTLAQGEPGYRGRCEGGVLARDEAYHQGTAWPWLLGPFVEAWLRARGSSFVTRREAFDRFVAPVLSQLDAAGMGHVAEIADGDAPHTPRGCPFQAWSVAEVLRLSEVVLRDR